jgi:hypothetical protein
MLTLTFIYIEIPLHYFLVVAMSIRSVFTGGTVLSVVLIKLKNFEHNLPEKTLMLTLFYKSSY